MPRYQLSVRAEKLPKGFFRKPNPYAEIKVSGGPREGETLGRTEVMEKALAPDWCKVIFLETIASIYLPLQVSIYNDRNGELLAQATFEATEVFQSPGHAQCQDDASTHKSDAKIYASIEESQKGNSVGDFTLHLRGLDIKNVEAGPLGLGRSDPFFEVLRKNADHAAGIVRWNVIYRSEYINDHLNPFWQPFTLNLEELCYGDISWPLKISVYDHQPSGKHRLIGEFETCIQELMQRIGVRGNADREMAFEVFAEGKSETRGLICVLEANLQLEEEHNNTSENADNPTHPAPPVGPQEQFSAATTAAPPLFVAEKIEF